MTDAEDLEALSDAEATDDTPVTPEPSLEGEEELLLDDAPAEVPVLTTDAARAPYRERYEAWRQDPSPRNLRAAVDSLQPTIDYSLRATGKADDPYMQAQAKAIAAKAIQSYDPNSGAALPTWTSQQMMRLRRIARQSSVARVPEKIQLEAFRLNQAEAEFLDRHDRDPDLDELSDATGISKARITEVRRAMRRTPSEEALGDLTINPTEAQYDDEALGIVYDGLDYTDRKLLEMKTGYGGKYDPMPPAEISKKLNLSITQVSRRSARIALQIQEIEEALRG